MQKKNYSVVLAGEPWQAQKLVHLIGSCTLQEAHERAKDLTELENAKHYMVIQTSQTGMVKLTA